MRKSNTIVLASNNKHKLEEFQHLFKSFPNIEIVSASHMIRNSDKLQAVETHSTYEENSMAKARLANQATHYPSIGDDSGLEVDALKGRPGVQSHRYSTPKAGQSQDEKNVEKLLDELKGRPMQARKARFICVLSLVMEGIDLHVRGILEGTIAEAPQGKGGFGYDPVFIPEGHGKTLAELTADEKNKLSHRGRAVRDLIKQIKSRGILLAKP